MPNLKRPLERQVKTLFFDIESSPLIGPVWRRYDTNLIDLHEDWRMLCFSYRWAHQKRVSVVAQCDFDDYDPDRKPWTHMDDRAVVEKLWELLDKCDIAVAHNGDQFDVKKVNGRFLEHGLGPPSPFKTVDTLKVARRRFKLWSNRLDDIGQQLGLGEKAPSSYALWDGCMRGDLRSWRKLRFYCRQDTHLLVAVYLELLPWMTNHPNVALMGGNLEGCRNCGGTDLRRDGWDYTTTRIRERYQCEDCGTWLHATRSLSMITAQYS